MAGIRFHCMREVKNQLQLSDPAGRNVSEA
jgi:hypothetical protein